MRIFPIFTSMKSSTNRLIATVIGTILLPLVLYAVYEISSMKEGEEVIEKIYRDQMDAIIFSVNQYSNDNIRSLLDKVEASLTADLTVDEAQPYLSYSNFSVLMFQEVNTKRSSQLILTEELREARNWPNLQDSLLQADPDLPVQLLRYKAGGYRKIEPKGIINIRQKELQVIHCILESNNEYVYATALLDIRGFSENVLAPKLQQIAQEELIITLGYRDSKDYIYQTDSLTNEALFKKSMWLFPELDVGLTSQNKTVSELVDERTQYNLVAALLLIFLLIFGFSLVIRNIRREMLLAQTKADFVSNVSHELRTPLSLISMFAETLLLDRVTSQAKRKEYEEIILKETNRLTNIVNKILNFSQIEANKKVYHPEKVKLNQIIDELLHDYAYHMERNGFAYDLQLEEDLPIIAVDHDALYEALVNLIDNAIKYSPHEKHISIRTGLRHQAVFVQIEDRGIGIAADKINQIFGKFYRVSEGNVHSTRGAGLGLALVSHIMDAHGGDIEVESTPGKGSIFRLVFYLDNHG